MLIWCITLFIIGSFALLDAIFNYGDIFRLLISISVMALSIWIYTKNRTLINLKNIEKLKTQNTELGSQVTQIDQSPAPKKKVPEKVY
jgi:hypothetical protein